MELLREHPEIETENQLLYIFLKKIRCASAVPSELLNQSSLLQKNKVENQDKRNIYKEIQKLHKQLSQYLVWNPNRAPVSARKEYCKVIEFSFCTMKITS